ncbi:MAG: CHAT domain-containing protein, partial [Acidimicrobiales bacterium]
MDRNEIHLEVSDNGPDDYLVRVLNTDADDAPSTTMHLDVDDLLRGLRQLEFSLLASAVPSRRLPAGGEEPLREIGSQLFHALFRGPVADIYRDRQVSSGQRGGNLRIVLSLAVPKLALLPWESMWDQEAQQYVCIQQPLIRRVPTPFRADPLPLRPPLSILGVVASPRGLPELDSTGEKELLKKALGEQIASGEVELTWESEASWDSVHDRMLDGRWHVLHFIGHGGYDAFRDEGRVALMGPDGSADWVPASRLAGLLGEADPAIRLVV